MKDEEYYDDDFYENSPRESCPNCNRTYDDIDFDFQSCSKCGFDSKSNGFDPEIIRKPSHDDYISGEADILTGRFW